MADHSQSSSRASIDAIEARLAEVEAGIIDPYTFTSRTLIQATFPHSSKAGKEIELVNGGMKVHMFSPRGLPYGTYPRVIMCWLTREAIRRKNLPIEEARTIPLGSSLSQFMREIGMKSASGGTDGNIARLRQQLSALFSTFISVELTGTEDREGMPRSFQQIDNTIIAESSMLWWDPNDPDAVDAQKSVVTLSKSFYRELIGSAVPLDTAILRAIRRSPMAIDIYCWLTYRLSYHQGITVVTWDQLRQQLGSGYPDTVQGKRNFKKKLIVALEKVLDAWPTASVSVTANGLMLRPGEPSVQKHIQEAIKRHYDNPF